MSLLSLHNLQVSIGVDMDLSAEQSLKSIYNLYELKQPIMITGVEQQFITVKNYAFDPSFAPKGKSTLEVVFFSDSEYWEKIYQDKANYKQEKNNVKNAVISALEEIIPDIVKKIEVIDVATPITIMRYTNNFKGSIMGFSRGILLNMPRTLPRLKNFFMAGHWTGDTSVPGAAVSGRKTLEYICKKQKKRFVTSKS